MVRTGLEPATSGFPDWRPHVPEPRCLPFCLSMSKYSSILERKHLVVSHALCITNTSASGCFNFFSRHCDINLLLCFFFYFLRWLKNVAGTFHDLLISMDRYSHSLSVDATFMVSKNCPIIGKHIAIIDCHSNNLTC